MKNIQTTDSNNSERGIISIMLTVVMMLVISLIVLGLAQISRRELRQSADSQLSAQAFYAAESGVNDAAKQLSTMVSATIPAKDDCGNAAPYNFNTVISAADGISYSCLLIEPNPTTLTATLSQDSQVLPLKASDGGALGSIKLNWTKPDGIPGTYSNCPSSTNRVFSPTWSWSCPYGLLRIDLVDTTSNSYDRDSLLNSTMTLFVVPTSAGGAGNATTPFSTNANAHIANGCATSCQLTISGLGGKEYYLRATEIYRTGGELNVSLNGVRGFTGAQAVVDATGKAQDVLRRVRVTLDIGGDNHNRGAVGGVMSGESICKQFYTLSGATYSNACP
jgi:Tfp pilus assembly protein PilV